MTFRSMITAGADAMLGAAQRIDDAAFDLQSGTGRTSLLSGILKITSFGVGVASVPLVVVDIFIEELGMAVTAQRNQHIIDEQFRTMTAADKSS